MSVAHPSHGPLVSHPPRAPPPGHITLPNGAFVRPLSETSALTLAVLRHHMFEPKARGALTVPSNLVLNRLTYEAYHHRRTQNIEFWTQYKLHNFLYDVSKDYAASEQAAKFQRKEIKWLHREAQEFVPGSNHEKELLENKSKWERKKDDRTQFILTHKFRGSNNTAGLTFILGIQSWFETSDARDKLNETGAISALKEAKLTWASFDKLTCVGRNTPDWMAMSWELFDILRSNKPDFVLKLLSLTGLRMDIVSRDATWSISHSLYICLNYLNDSGQWLPGVLRRCQKPELEDGGRKYQDKTSLTSLSLHLHDLCTVPISNRTVAQEPQYDDSICESLQKHLPSLLPGLTRLALVGLKASHGEKLAAAIHSSANFPINLKEFEIDHFLFPKFADAIHYHQSQARDKKQLQKLILFHREGVDIRLADNLASSISSALYNQGWLQGLQEVHVSQLHPLLFNLYKDDLRWVRHLLLPPTSMANWRALKVLYKTGIRCGEWTREVYAAYDFHFRRDKYRDWNEFTRDWNEFTGPEGPLQVWWPLESVEDGDNPNFLSVKGWRIWDGENRARRLRHATRMDFLGEVIYERF